MTSIEIAAVQGADIRCVGDTNCSIARAGQTCGRPAGLAFNVGGRLVPACARDVALALGRGTIAIAGGAR